MQFRGTLVVGASKSETGNGDRLDDDDGLAHRLITAKMFEICRLPCAVKTSHRYPAGSHRVVCRICPAWCCQPVVAAVAAAAAVGQPSGSLAFRLSRLPTPPYDPVCSFHFTS